MCTIQVDHRLAADSTRRTLCWLVKPKRVALRQRYASRTRLILRP